MEWEVGQTVLIVPHDNRRNPYEEKIGKIARKWVTLDPEWRGRFDRHTGQVDGGRGYSPTGKAWPSPSDYHAWKARDEKWREMHRKLPYSVPDHLTDFDLDLICDLIAGTPIPD